MDNALNLALHYILQHLMNSSQAYINIVCGFCISILVFNIIIPDLILDTLRQLNISPPVWAELLIFCPTGNSTSGWVTGLLYCNLTRLCASFPALFPVHRWLYFWQSLYQVYQGCKWHHYGGIYIKQWSTYQTEACHLMAWCTTTKN